LEGEENQLNGAIENYLENVATIHKPGQKDADDTLYSTSLKLLIYEYMRLQEIENALEVSKTIIERYPDSKLEEFTLFDQFNIYLELLELPDQATGILATLEKKYPKSSTIFHARAALDLPVETHSSYTSSTLHELESPSDIPDCFQLFHNYPNPFNPSTEIKFALPEAGNVELRIFNQLGQQVAVLVNGFQQAGVHSVFWNGCDELGNTVASGVYFYKIRAGSFEQTRKMILLL